MKAVLVIVAAFGFGLPAVAFAAGKTQVIAASDLQAQLTQLAPLARTKGSSGSNLLATGNLALKLSVRTSSGGAEIHANFDDLMIVQQGSATLITGGIVVNPQTGADGETHGTSVANGQSRIITVGDIVVVPAGVPHQLLIPPGTIYSALVAKIKE